MKKTVKAKNSDQGTGKELSTVKKSGTVKKSSAVKQSSAEKKSSTVNKSNTVKKSGSAKATATAESGRLDPVLTGGHDAAPGAPGRRSAEQIAVTATGPRPVPELTTAVRAPHPELLSHTLASGLQVLAVRKPGTPLVEVRLRVPFGGSSATHSARAELLAATLLLGSASRSREQVDADLARVGGHLDASVDPVRLAVTGSVLSTGLSVLLDVLAESITDPALNRHDVLGERARLVEQLAISASQPSIIARKHLQAQRFGTHPVTREMPDPDVVAGVGVAALRALHRRSVVPRGSTLVLVGDVDPQQAIAAVDSALGGWTAPDSARTLGDPGPVVGGPMAAFHRDGAVQSQVRLSAAALDRTDPDYAAGQLANLIYGGYFSSRLVENIREDKGYTYSAHSGFEFWPGRAAVTVSFDTTTPSTAAALLEARYELGRLALTPPQPAEIESARNYALGTLATSLSTQAGYASTLSSLAGLGLDPGWVVEHPARLAAVTTEDVARVAASLLAPSAFTGVVVGDLAAIGSSLAAIGGVQW